MSTIILLHNPKSGDEAHSAQHLKTLVEQEGHACRYFSSKDESWQQLVNGTHILAVAGGDGTVRQAAKVLLQSNIHPLPTLAVIPSGTANNIATSLHMGTDAEAIIKSWKNCRLTPLDVGAVKCVNQQQFFIESIGFGVLPKLMKTMDEIEVDEETPEKEIQLARDLLHDITCLYQARHCHIMIDGQDYSGSYLMVEVLNIAFVGPNLNLAPLANPGDGELEIMLVPEDRREEFKTYIRAHQNQDDQENLFFKPIRGRHIELKWGGTDAHVDDEVIALEASQSITIGVNEGALNFLL
jgi:diacylglycerol kinase (ATP)